MKVLRWMCLVVWISACGVASTESTSEPPPVDEPGPEAGPEEIALLTAAATGDPQLMAAAAAQFAAACHSTAPCTGYGSCGTWSAAVDCGDSFCSTNACGPRCPPDDPYCEIQLVRVQGTESYRVCFNAQGASCTEWKRSSRSVGCGVGGCNTGGALE